MPMKVVCANCGKQFSAWDDLVGKPVQCPKCQHTMILGGANPALDSPPTTAAPPAKKPNPATRQPPPAQQRPKSSAPVSPAQRTENPATPRTASPAAAPRPASALPAAQATPRTSPVPRSAPVPKPSADLDADDSLPLGCPKCNAPMEKDDDLCDACGYHLILKKVIDVSDMKKLNKTTGFERFLQDQLHESESGHNVLALMKIVGAILVVVILFMCLGRWWWIGVLAFGGAAAFYWSLYRRRASESESDDSPINQDPLSAVLWTMLLTMQRVLGWRHLTPPFTRANSLTLRNMTLTDEELSELEGLAEKEALDFEGTSITNEGLQHLRPLKQLQFLVLRRTQVTPSAIRKLQVELPQTMIWH